MYVSDCTNIYASSSEGYPTQKEACDNCVQESITDLGPPVGQCGSNSVENFQVFDNNTPMNVLKIAIMLVILALLCYGGYKLFHH